MYKLTQNPDLVRNLETGTDIPRGHPLWAEYESWCAEGNTPDPAETLDEMKASKLTQLSSACQAQIYAGFQSSALGSAHAYPAKDKDQANLAASVLSSLYPGLPAGWTTPFWCADAQGNWTYVQHTAAQIQQVGADGKAAILAALQKNATLAQQVMAATTTSELESIVW